MPQKNESTEKKAKDECKSTWSHVAKKPWGMLVAILLIIGLIWAWWAARMSWLVSALLIVIVLMYVGLYYQHIENKNKRGTQ